MKHRYRFFGEPSAPGVAVGTWTIGGEEVVHLRKVLRLNVGEVVELCDGAGLTAVGPIVSVQAQEAVVAGEQGAYTPPPAAPLVMALGALRPALVDELLPSLIELGADEIHVFLAEQVDKGRVQERVVARWQKIARTALKQCKRAHLPQLTPAPSLAQLLSSWQARPGLRLHVSEKGEASILTVALPPATAVFAVVGGEKGLNPAEEAALAAAGFCPVNLGPYILRAYTAAIAATSILALRRSPSGNPQAGTL